MGCPLKRLLEFRLLGRLELGGLDLADLKAQQIQLAHVRILVDDQLGFLRGQAGPLVNERGEVDPLFFQPAVSVENLELPRGLEQRLVVVRAVDVHEPFADGGEHVERGRRAVDELPVAARGRKTALEEELIFLARLDAVLVEVRVKCFAKAGDLDYCLDRAVVVAVPDEGAVGPLAEHEAKRADEDRLASAGLAGDRVVARAKLDGQVVDEGEVFDSEIGQHAPDAGECGNRSRRRQNKTQ